MAYQLSASDIAEALKISGMTAELEALESAVATAAKALATKHGVVCDVENFGRYGMTQPGFGGLCIPFYAAHDGQALPDAFDGLDNDEEWGMRS